MLRAGNIFFSLVSNLPTGELVMDICNRKSGFRAASTVRGGTRGLRRRSVFGWVASGRSESRQDFRPIPGGPKRMASCATRRLGCVAALACLAISAVFPARACAQRMDSFEGGEPRWILVDSDCQAQLTNHEISPILPHSGRTCELFDVACASGSLALLAYPIEPSVIVDEFQPAVWTRSSSGRMQLGVRVIFPFAEHPVTAGRLNTILWGDTYSETGQWQILQVGAIQKKLSAELVSLRQRYGTELNLEGAYIDCLVFNAYSGPGRYRVQLDDLNLRGLIPMSATGNAFPSNWREKWRWRHEVIKPSAEQTFWASPNLPPTWLHYQGESLPWIKSLGFTGLILNQLPSTKQLLSIHESGLSAICPPPPHNLVIEPRVSVAIKGWLVGSALDARQADVARSQSHRVLELPEELRRPLIGEALEQYWLFSRIADEVILPYPAPLSAGTTREKIEWVTQNLETTKKRGAGWVSIDVGSNPAVKDQIRKAHEIIAPSEPLDASQANPLGLRYLATSSVLAGARGLVFRTFEPLDLQTAGDSSMVAALRWIHSDLALWGPWISGGQISARPVIGRADYSATMWSVSQSQMVIALATPPEGQYCVPATSGQPLAVGIANSGVAQQVLRLTTGRLERMEAEATPVSLKWQVPNPAPVETFVITANPLVIDFVRKQLALNNDQRAADQLEVVSYTLGLAGRLTEARFPGTADAGPPEAAVDQLRRLALAQNQLEQGYQALRARQAMGASALATRASDLIQSVIFEAQQMATSNLAAPQSSPFVVSPATLRYHWLLADACGRSEWRALELPGAQFQDLAAMLDSGWSQQRRLEDQVSLSVELLPHASGRPPGLRLAAYAKASAPDAAVVQINGGYEGASLRVRSSAAQVRAGQLVRVAATARILRAPRVPEGGVLIYDNQAGPSLGQLVRGNQGDQVEIELYRFVVADGEFRVLAECRGECDIVLESLNASVIEPAANRKSFVTTPSIPLQPGSIIVNDGL